MASLQPPLSVRVIVEGSKYKINVRRPAHEKLRDICRVALTQHLAAIFEIDEDEAESMVDGGSIKVIRVQEEDGSILRLSDTVSESGFPEGSFLRSILKISDDKLSERVRSLSSALVDESPKLISGSLTSGSPSSLNRQQESSSSDSNFILEMRIDGNTSNVEVKSGELLRDVCQLAIVEHVKKLHRLNKEDAVAMISSQQIKVLKVEAAGKGLDLDVTVSTNGLSGGATLDVTLAGLTRDADPQEETPQEPQQEPSISSSTFQPADIRKATNSYSELNIVGKGGQATVYKGSLHGSMVAVKKYKSMDFTDMEREIEVLQQVRHRNVILLMGYCREENCIVSEFMEGGSLQDRLRDKPDRWSWADRYRVAKEIVFAIYYLHNCNILHRDLKPANILFDSHETVKVADMGFAKLSAATMTISGGIGTVGYVDPTFLNSNRTSKSVDVYSLGLIILQLCTHKESVVEIHDILKNNPQGQKSNAKFGMDLFKEAMVAFDPFSIEEKMGLTLLEVGLQCAEKDSIVRPTLEQVTRTFNRVDSGFLVVSDVTSNKSTIDSMKLTDLISSAENGNVEAQFRAGQRYHMGDSVKQNKNEAVTWYDKAAKNGHMGAVDALQGLFENHYLSLHKQSWFKGSDTTFIQEHAKHGVSAAQFFLGKCYSEGIGVKNDKVTAVKWYTEAANKGHRDARYNLALCYSKGQGVEKDMGVSMQWYTIAAKQGHIEAQYDLGFCYENGVEKDMATAVKWYIKAAEQGHCIAQDVLGICYENGKGVEQDMATAVQWYTRAAEQGYKEGQYNVGNCFYYGRGVEINMATAVKWYTEAAEKGLMEAQLDLGICYKNGKGVKKDLLIAVNWFTKAAKQGLAEAQYKLGECFCHGWGVEKDMVIAVRWYTEAAKKELSIAEYNLGVCHKNGKGVEKDMPKAVMWYTKAAMQEHLEAQYELGFCYENGQGVEKDMATAVEWYSKAAKKGYSKAQNNLGFCYKNGQGVEEDMATAVKWYKKAAKQELKEAQYNLGECFYNGWGVEKDMSTAVMWYMKAATQELSIAQYVLGLCYRNGKGVEKDMASGVKWYTKAAKQGHSKAQNDLGFCYENGQGVKKDIAIAVKWYTESAEEGLREAQYNLGECFFYGRGMERNMAMAVKWYTKAANQGHSTAQFNLGFCYKNGQGVDKDAVTALEWYTKAAEQGHSPAKYDLGFYFKNRQSE